LIIIKSEIKIKKNFENGVIFSNNADIMTAIAPIADAMETILNIKKTTKKAIKA
jgi:hypothetical protein